MARYANWQSGEAQTFVTLWVRLPPVPLERVVFLAAGCKPVVTKQARWTTRGSIPSRLTDNGPFVYRQDASLSGWKGGFDSRTGHSRAKWWNWQTRDAQNVVPQGVGVRISPWSL